MHADELFAQAAAQPHRRHHHRPGQAHRSQFAQIAERGIATEEDEAVLGESSVAAPVVDRSGTVIAAVSVVLPSSEWPPEDNVLNDLRETARNISRELGATAWPPAPTVP